MAVNSLNRFGPISFKSETNNSENLSINSLLSNFYTVGSNNFSLSESYRQLEIRQGNYTNDTKTNNVNNALGVGLINKDDRRPIRFSEFYGASFLSSSFKVASSTGVATVKIYSPSVVQNNNFLTNNIQDKVFKYTLYSKNDNTVPISDTGWNKVYSYAKSGDNIEQFYNLVDTNAYKLVAKDCLSNAFTSSMFIGTCTNTVTDNTTYYYSINSENLSSACSLIFKQINSDKSTNGYTNTQLSDLSNILTNLSNILPNPNIKTFKPNGELFPTIYYKDIQGYRRTISFDGLILQKSNQLNGTLGYFYTGMVTATSENGSIYPSYEYSFENTTTFGQINLYIIGKRDSIGSSCTSQPTKKTNLPTNVSFSGPRCGGCIDCGTGKPQPVCNPTSTTQIKHTGSFILTNNNNDDLLVTLGATWTDLSGNPLNSQLLPVTVNPAGLFNVPANSTRKISIGFGLSNYSNPSQPISFVAKNIATLNLPIGYSPQMQTCEIIANFDKNSCNINQDQLSPPVATPITSNIGCILSKSTFTDRWTSIKSNAINLINSGTGTVSDKIFAKSIINALPNTYCVLPTSYTQDGYTISLTWTLDENGSQPYECEPLVFSGTYNVVATNDTLTTAYFTTSFLRYGYINAYSPSHYIFISQENGISAPL